jgi:hypothetical protein
MCVHDSSRSCHRSERSEGLSVDRCRARRYSARAGRTDSLPGPRRDLRTWRAECFSQITCRTTETMRNCCQTWMPSVGPLSSPSLNEFVDDSVIDIKTAGSCCWPCPYPRCWWRSPAIAATPASSSSASTRLPAAMAAGSITGAILGGQLLGAVPAAVLVALLVAPGRRRLGPATPIEQRPQLHLDPTVSSLHPPIEGPVKGLVGCKSGCNPTTKRSRPIPCTRRRAVDLHVRW